jgi:hypothetical protein
LFKLSCLRGFFFTIRWRSGAICKKKLNNLVLVVSLSKLKGSYLLLVLMQDVNSLFNHVIHSLEPTGLYCVEQRRLSVLIDYVNVGSKRNQLLDGLVIALSNTVEDRRLTVNVDVIWV